MAHRGTALLLARGAISGLCCAWGSYLPVRLELLLMQCLMLGSKLGKFFLKFADALSGLVQILTETIDNPQVLLIGLPGLLNLL
jgi:hypothetical protein